MVTFFLGAPVHSRTVFADEQGRFLSPAMPWADGYKMNLVLDEFDNRDQLLEFKMQCTYCHQQSSPLTSRRQFTREQWLEIISDMARRSAITSDSLKAVLLDYLVAAYDDANVLQKLPAYDSPNGPLPAPSAEVRKAVIEEWDLGGPLSGQHDLMASLAKVQVAETFRLVSDEAIQMFGGIGMTDEEDVGFYLKRIRVAQQTLGDEHYHVQRYATLRGY